MTPKIGERLIGPNGSVGIIIEMAKKVANHAIVRITNPNGYHQEGDYCVWPLTTSNPN